MTQHESDAGMKGTSQKINNVVVDFEVLLLT